MVLLLLWKGVLTVFFLYSSKTKRAAKDKFTQHKIVLCVHLPAYLRHNQRGDILNQRFTDVRSLSSGLTPGAHLFRQ